MSEHPIQGLMRTAMENIRQMVDVNTIVGEPVTAPDGTLIMPVSKVAFGFAAGGSEFTTDRDGAESAVSRQPGAVRYESRADGHAGFPFGGGSGGGVSITPIAFLVVGAHGVKVVPLDHSSRMLERILDQVPALAEKFAGMFGGGKAEELSVAETAGAFPADDAAALPREPAARETSS